MTQNPFEIPPAMRDQAEQNIKQAHAAYEQLTDFLTKAIGAWTGAMPSNFMTAAVKDVQGRAVEIAKKNAGSAFALIEKIAKAQNFQEILTLQMQFAQDRMQTFAAQTQQLFGLMGEAFQKSEPGALGTGVEETPSNLLVNAFKDATDSAGAMANTNAGPASAPAEKIANPMEIPQAMKETHAAHDQITDLATKSVDAWKGAMRAGLAAAHSKDVQDRAMEIAKKHAESASVLAEMIAKAQNFPAPSDNEPPADTPNGPSGSPQEKPLRRKSAKSKTASSGTSPTPPVPSPAPEAPQRSRRSKPKAVKKQAAARGAALAKDD